MTEMVERVARAIRRGRFERTGRGAAFDESMLNDNDLADARAALEAMREPTARMLSHGPYIDEINAAVPPITESQAHAAWEAMIDAALTSPAQSNAE